MQEEGVLEGPHDLPGIGDSIGGGIRGTGDIDGRDHPRGIPEKAMPDAAVAVEVSPHDLPGIVDPEGVGFCGTGDIDDGEHPRGIPEKAKAAAYGQDGRHDRSWTVDPKGAG